jgi:beta-lactam-binding protein with PASTA domain
MSLPPFLARPAKYVVSLATNTLFWAGLAAVIVLAALLLLTFDRAIMPSYTRQDVAVVVPDVENVPFENARRLLEARDLQVERIVQRFNPNIPRETVVDQNPPPNTRVKPGRHIYLSVNSGSLPTVTVPRVEGLALREAKNRMITAGLRVASERPDPVPSPYENTVTDQSPPAGTTVDRGSSVTLWYSTGLGSEYVEVPDVKGMTIEEARRALLALRLRSVAVDAISEEDTVSRQSRAPGTHVRQGFEIRLFTETSSQ